MNSFCPNLFNHVMNDSFGVYKACCMHVPDNTNGIAEGISVERPIEEFWNNPKLVQQRVKSIQGEYIRECEVCYKAEQNGGTSLRKDLVKEYENNKQFIEKVQRTIQNNGVMLDFPSSVEFRVGNLCNLKCRMCQPQDSNLINNEYKEIISSTSDESIISLLPTIENPVDMDTDAFIQSVKDNIVKVDIMRFSGGEPLINKSFYKLLDFFVESGHSRDIDLRINTNMTKLTEETLHKFLKFKNVNIDFSIDGIEDTYEYIRYPMKWSIINKKIEMLESFLKKFNPKINVYVNFTVQTYNILHMLDFIDYFIPKGFLPILHPVHHPPYLSIKNTPDSLKPILSEKLKNKIQELNSLENDKVYLPWVCEKITALLNLIEVPSDPSEIKNFLKFTKALDGKRNQNFMLISPEINKHFLELA